MEPSSHSAAEEPTRWHARGTRGPSTTADAAGLTLRRNLRRVIVPWRDVASIAQERRTGYLVGWTAVVRLNDGTVLTDLPGISTTDGTFSDQTEAALDTLTDYWQRALAAPLAPVSPPSAAPSVNAAPAGPSAPPRRVRPSSSALPTTRRRVLATMLTSCVVGALGFSIFGLYNSAQRLSVDHSALAGYESPQSCTPDGAGWQPPSVWCSVTNLEAIYDSSSDSLLLLYASDSDPGAGSDSATDDLISVYADFGQVSSVPPGIDTTTPLTAVVRTGSDDAASVNFDAHTYQTTASPQVQYTSDTESLIAALVWTSFMLIWTTRRLIRRRGPALLGWALLAAQYSTLFAALTAISYAANHESVYVVGTSITPDVVTTALVALGAGAVTGHATRHRLRRATRY